MTDPLPLLRVGLRRIELRELVAADQVLRDCDFSRALSTRAAEGLFAAAQVRRYPDGVSLFQAHTPGDSLFWILKGEVRLVGGKGENLSELRLVKGEVMGEHEALGHAHARSFSAWAVAEVNAAELPRAALAPLYAQHPPLRMYLEALDVRRRSASAELSDFLKRW